MSFLKREFEKNKFRLAFFISLSIAVLLVGVAFIALIIYYGSFGEMKTQLGYTFMSDFGQIIYFSLTDNPYSSGFPTIYLPLSNLVMYPFAVIAKSNPTFYMLDNYEQISGGAISLMGSEVRYIDLYNLEVLKTKEFWIIVALYYTTHLALIGWLVYSLRKWEKFSDFLYGYLALVFSSLVFVGVYRGTNVFTCLLLILFFYKFYKSNNIILKELALIALAVAGVVRLYPFLFGAILLREKRFFASARVVIYSIILAILPFAMYGNIGAVFKDYLSNLQTFIGGEGRETSAMNFYVGSIINYLFSLISVSGSAPKIIGYIVWGAIALATVAVAIFAKQRIVSLMAICAGIMVVTPVAYFYVAMFFILPIVLLLDDFKNLSKKRKKWYVWFLLFMSFLPLSIIGWYVVHVIVIATFIIVEFVNLFNKRKSGEIL